VAELPDVAEYNFEFTSKGQIDLFTIKSCHQYQVIESGYIIKRKSAKFKYRPLPFERNSANCPIMFHAYEKDKGRHSFGMIDFARKAYKATAQIECNGSSYTANGTAICQSNIGLYQTISFNKDAKFKSECENSIEKYGAGYRIKLSKGLCLTTFLVDGQLFRLTTYGYEKVLVY